MAKRKNILWDLSWNDPESDRSNSLQAEEKEATSKVAEA